MTDNEIIALYLCQESLGIDSENYFWSKLKSEYSKDFPTLIHITRYKPVHFKVTISSLKKTLSFLNLSRILYQQDFDLISLLNTK